MIIDTHLHMIDQSALRYPWLAGAPALNRDFSYEEYAREAQARRHRRDAAHGGRRRPGRHRGGDRLCRRAVAAAGQPDRGAIAACRPEDAGFAAFLERQRSNPFVKGFRRVLHVMPDELSEGALFRENIKRLAGTGLTFDLCVLPHQIPKAIALVDLAPDVQFILDHCGVPDIKGGAEHPWREHMTEIARRPNVVGKISGVVAYADAESWTRRDAATLCRAHDRRVRLGSRRLGQRLAGLHAGRRALDLGRRNPCADRRRQRRREGEAAVGEREADLEAACEIGSRISDCSANRPSLTTPTTVTLARLARKTLAKQPIEIVDDAAAHRASPIEPFIDAVRRRLLERHVAVMARPHPGAFERLARVAR